MKACPDIESTLVIKRVYPSKNTKEIVMPLLLAPDKTSKMCQQTIFSLSVTTETFWDSSLQAFHFPMHKLVITSYAITFVGYGLEVLFSLVPPPFDNSGLNHAHYSKVVSAIMYVVTMGVTFSSCLSCYTPCGPHMPVAT